MSHGICDISGQQKLAVRQEYRSNMASYASFRVTQRAPEYYSHQYHTALDRLPICYYCYRFDKKLKTD